MFFSDAHQIIIIVIINRISTVNATVAGLYTDSIPICNGQRYAFAPGQQFVMTIINANDENNK